MRQLLAFLLKNYFFFLFLMLEIIAFILIANHTFYQGARMFNTANQLTGNVYQTYNNIFDYFYLKDNNRMLAEENARLRNMNELSFVKFTKSEINVNDTFYRQQYTFVEAKIISNSTGKRNNYLMLNKGFNQGVRNNMAVVSSNGIVGIVNGVSSNFSSIMSLLHSETKISAKLKKNNATGSVSWEGGSYKTGLLADIPSHILIKTGDTVITSGFSLDFPEGIVIGTVATTKLNPGDNFYQIKINFSTDFNKLDNVYVVKNLFKEEQLKLKEIQHE
ncbi:MAG: rod shape-determining protein MreC [Bacteroidetes bacterium]|nr:rod shape-determining protein MreC [Bacteroidota bacterium]